MSTKSTLNFKALKANKDIGARNYWRSRLAEFEFKPYFVDSTMPAISNGEEFGTHTQTASEHTHRAFVSIAESDKSRHIVLLSSLGILAHKLSGLSDVSIFSSAYLVEPASDAEADIIPVRMSNFSGTSFTSFLTTLSQSFIQDSAHGNYPVDKIVKDFKDLFAVGMLVEQAQGASAFDGFPLDLLFSFSAGETLILTVKYNAQKFSARYIGQIVALYLNCLEKLIAGRKMDIASIEIIPEQQKQQVLYEFNNTKVDYPEEETILSLFEQQVEKNPGQVALQWSGNTLSYKGLKERSDKIAAYLQKEIGIEAGDLVGVMLACEEHFVPLVLGILKAGGAYVPIDPGYPSERVKAIIEDSKLEVLVTRGKHKDKSPADVKQIDLDQALNAINAQQPGSLSVQVNGDMLAYVIYTSGSTGKPKGVMIEHKALRNYIKWAAKQYVKHEAPAFALFTSIAFDLTVTSIFAPLITGGKIVIYKEDDHALLVEKVFADNEATVIKLTPSHLRIVKDSKPITPSKLKVLIVGGEELQADLAEVIHKKFAESVEIYNEYGPTEATVGCMIHEFDPRSTLRSVPIGIPMNNTQIYLLDAFLKPVPVGIVGELYISGDGLARGYLNNEALSKERFVTNPFVKGERMYRTGDLAVMSFEGIVLFKGRIDDQVKLRGYRIELADIVSHLVAHSQVNEAFVELKGNEEDKYLVAYYVSQDEVAVSEFRKFLENRLPEYMIPSYYVRLEKVPLTVNGKLDRKSLPDPAISSNGYEAPTSEVEEKLIEIWSQVLKVDKEKIGVNRSFFELGGNSLKIVLMLNKAFKELNVLIPINVIFNHQTVKSLNRYIQGLDKSAYSPVKKTSPKEYYKLSSAQKRLYVVYQYHKASLAYNGIIATRLTGDLDKKQLLSAFQELVRRHESLRTSFEVVDGAPVQKIHDRVDFGIEHFRSKNEGVSSIIDDFMRPFDLTKTPLLRVGLIETSPQEHVLLVDMHHIITDGVSQNILIKDLMAFYRRNALPELQLQYKDYAAWQQSEAQQEDIARQKEFWINEFSNDLETLALPTDFTRPVFKSFGGSSVSFEIGVETARKVRAIAEKEKATMFMVVLSMFNILLSKLSGQQDIVIGTPTAGRRHADLEGIVGMFVNTLALRNYPEGSLSFRQFLSNVRSKTLSCFDNHAYPYEELVDNLGIQRDTSRNPLFDVMFAYQDFEKTIIEVPGLTLEPYDVVHSVSKFDLTLTVKDNGDTLFFDLEYSTDLFRRETIERFTGYFEKILSTIVADIDVKLLDIDIISDEERQKLLFDFNDTKADYPKAETIVSMFEAQVKRTPNHTALRFGDETLDYNELNNAANKVASYLRRALGVVTGDLVGLMLEREEYMIPCIFGILKAGAAYVPIDPHYPVERINEIITTSKLKALITRKKHCDASLRISSGLVDLDEAGHAIKDQSANAIDVKLKGSDLAYVIFTSGSTGVPKGVMIEHHSVVNRLLWMQKQYPIATGDVLLQKTPIVFDVSVWELFWWSFIGASLYLLKPGGERDRKEIVRVIEAHKITTIHFVPSMLNIFLSAPEDDLNAEQLGSLRYVFASGEALTPQHVNLFGDTVHKNCNARLINLYGPTEATVDVSFYECTFDRKCTVVPIGKPIDNTAFYILDKNGHLAPVGVSGELYVAGAGVARGYLNNKELTDVKFVQTRYSSGEKMYRTGDLARWLPDGDVEFLGRMDNQVKIRGFRIELGEIENHLCSHEDVKEAVVLVKEREGDRYLVAYYVSDQQLDEVELRVFLSGKLAGYMVPAYYVRLEHIPLTGNGKLNKKALPDPDLDAVNDDARPINDTQKELVKIWSEVLDVGEEKIPVNRNFFHIGGDSLKLIRMVDKINRRFEIELTVADMFKFPMISLLARFLNKENEIGSSVEEDAEKMNHAFELYNQIRE